MKGLTVILGVCVLVLGASSAFLFSSNQKKEAETVALREKAAEADSVREELERIKATGNEAQQEEIARLRKDNVELLRLRNEKQQLTRQLEATRSGVQRQEHQMQQLQSENQQVRTAAQQAQQSIQVNACINNLRQIGVAKQQWALEHKKSPAMTPTIEEVSPYFKDRTLPLCPAGGVYTLNVVSNVATCSIPGHALQ